MATVSSYLFINPFIGSADSPDNIRKKVQSPIKAANVGIELVLKTRRTLAI